MFKIQVQLKDSVKVIQFRQICNVTFFQDFSYYVWTSACTEFYVKCHLHSSPYIKAILSHMSLSAVKLIAVFQGRFNVEQ